MVAVPSQWNQTKKLEQGLRLNVSLVSFFRLALAILTSVSVCVAPISADAQGRKSKKKMTTIYDAANEKRLAGSSHPAAVPEKIKVAKSDYLLLIDKNKRGVPTRQMVMGKDRLEIMIDRNGDGGLEDWEVTVPGATMRMHTPFKGRFMFMDVDHHMKGTVVKLRLALNERTGDYVLYDTEQVVIKPKHQLKSDILVGCRESEMDLQRLSNILEQNLKDDAQVLAMSENMKANLFDSSCKTGDFAQTFPYMLEAITNLAKSDTQYTGERPKEKGNFLQCVRYYEFDTHAARITSALAQFHTESVEAFNRETNVPSHYRYNWKIRCEADADMEGEYLDPLDATDLPTVKLTRNFKNTNAEMKQQYGKNYDKAAAFTKRYQQTLMHELLHFSLMDDEDVAENLTKCCSEDNPASEACKETEKFRDRLILKQKAEGAWAAAMGADAFKDFKRSLITEFGDNARMIMDDLNENVGFVYKKVSESPECANGNGQSEACQKRFQTEIKKVVDMFFKNNGAYCIAFAKGKGPKFYEYTMEDGSVQVESMGSKAGAFCKKLEAAVNYMYKLTPEDISKSSICRAPETNVQNMRSLEKTWALLLMEKAHASTQASSGDLLCRAISNANHQIDYSDLDNIGYKPQDGYNAAPRALIPDAGNAVSDDVDGETRVGTVRGPEVNLGSNPNRGSYQSDLGQRVAYLDEHFRRSNGVLDRTKQIASQLAKQIVPSAQASTGNGPTIRSDNGTTIVKSPKDLPSLQVPNPMSLKNDHGTGLSTKDQNVNPASPPVFQSAVAPGRAGPSDPGPRARGGEQGKSGEKSGNQASGVNPQPSGTAGPARNVAAAGQPDEKQLREAAAADERALRSLIIFLTRPYKKVKPELSRPTVVGALLRHQVQVIDQEGRVHGSGFPKHKFVYDRDKDKLVLKSAPK